MIDRPALDVKTAPLPTNTGIACVLYRPTLQGLTLLHHSTSAIDPGQGIREADPLKLIPRKRNPSLSLCYIFYRS
jgi:hypothetical protein